MTRLVFDLNHLAWRNFYTQRELKTTTGVGTAIPFGVIRGVRTLAEKYKADQIVLCQDVGKSWRAAVLESYKSTRGAANATTDEDRAKALADRDEFSKQLEGAIEMVKTLGIPVVSSPGLEADDLCAIVARKLPFEGRTIVVSGDKDLLQLVGGDVCYHHPHYNILVSEKGERLDPALGVDDFKHAFNRCKEIHPESFTRRTEKLDETDSRMIPFSRWILYRALVGDSADDLSGIVGIGTKTAVPLVTQYATAEELIAAKEAGQLKLSARVLGNLTADALSLQIQLIDLSIITEAPEASDLSAEIAKQVAETVPDIQNFRNFLRLYEMNSISSEVPKFLQYIPSARSALHS